MTEEVSLTKSELIERMVSAQSRVAGLQLTAKDVWSWRSKRCWSRCPTRWLRGERIEIRGFGSFSLHYRAPRSRPQPKDGRSRGTLPGKHVPHFKPGKELRERVNPEVANNEA